MKRKPLYSAMLVLSFLLAVIQPALAQDEEGQQMPPEESQVPGETEGTGTYFKVTDSEYLNITLESSESIHLILESVPEMVRMDLEAAGDATSTEISLRGFLPSTTYYRYEDDYHNSVTFTTDVNGAYTYTQDLSEPHLVFIQPRASTIFIPQDTSVGTWDPVTRTYTLTTDVYETIEIDENNLTLDGAGHTVTGADTGFGVYLKKRNGITITNINVQQFHTGIFLVESSNNTLTNNSANLNTKAGIILLKSNNNTLTNNSASSNLVFGIYLDRSSNSTLRNNTMSGNRPNFCVDASMDDHFDNDIDTTNTVDGKPVYYVRNAVGEVYDSSTNAGVFYAFNCEGITIKDLTLENNHHGVFLWKTHNSRIENVFASNNNESGIYLGESSGNTLTGNTTSSNDNRGIRLTDSSNNSLTNNTASNNNHGIHIGKSSNNTLIDNTMSGNHYNFSVDGSLDSHFDNDIDTTNTVDGKPVYYVKNAVGEVYDSSTNAGTFYAINCDNITIKDLTLNNNHHGVLLWKTDNSRIENIVASDYGFGIRLRYSSNNILTGNSLVGDLSWGPAGIMLNSSSNNTLTGNATVDNMVGIDLQYCNGNTLMDNTVSTSTWNGIWLRESNNNTLISNTMSSNRYNLTVDGKKDNHFDNDIDTTNTVDGKPVYYVKGAVDQVYDSSTNAGIFYAISCDNIAIRDLTIANSENGIFLWKTHNSTIENIVFSVTGAGIHLYESSHNTLTGNTALNTEPPIGSYHNNKLGIRLIRSHSNTLTNNTLNSNLAMGILLDESNGNTLIDNTANSNEKSGIVLDHSDDNTLTSNAANSNEKEGIWLGKSSNNTLTGNTANSNKKFGIDIDKSHSNTLTNNTTNLNGTVGIKLTESSNSSIMDNTANSNEGRGIYLEYCNNNVLTGNTTSLNNWVGIRLFKSNDNQIYNNNFMNNVTQAKVVNSSGNLFNLDKPTGGNFWSDWTSPDADGDGFVDSPYVFEGGTDYLPWTHQDGWFPAQAVQNSINVCQDIIDSNPGTPLADKVEDGLASLENALDELSKTPPDNQAAVGNIEGAVGDLEAAISEGLDPDQGEDLMDELAGIARHLAVDALYQAIDQGGDSGEISDAQQALAEGDALRGLETFKDAANKYKDALAKAESALS